MAEAEGKKDNSRIGQQGGKDMLQLLRDCSGSFRPGILTALVGSSGAGKVGRRPRTSFRRKTRTAEKADWNHGRCKDRGST